MDQLHPPPAMQLEGNLSENWRKWKQRYELYEAASGLAGKEEGVKASAFLHIIGQESLDIYITFT